jgi:hypothetical protein
LAYRESGPPPCHICEDNPAVGTCACCNRDVCKRHLPSEDARGWCTRCDEGYFRYIRKTSTMRGYLRWWLGMVPAIAAPFVYTPLFALTVAYVIVGFPVAMWRSKVARTNQFILHARKTGHLLEAPKDAGSEIAEGLRDYDYRRRNQQAVTEHVEKPEE